MPASAQRAATNNNGNSANARAWCSKAPTPPSVKFGTTARATATAADTRVSVARNPVSRPAVGVPRRVRSTNYHSKLRVPTNKQAKNKLLNKQRAAAILAAITSRQ